MNRFRVVLCFGLLLLGGLARAELAAEGYARETPPGAPMSAAYLTLNNAGEQARRLQRVELPGLPQASAEIHETVLEQGVTRMRALQEVEVPARGSLQMAPGGVHLMLHSAHLRAGEPLRLRLHFADGQTLDIELPVQAAGDQRGGGHHGHHHH